MTKPPNTPNSVPRKTPGAPEKELEQFILTPMADARTGVPYLTLTHTCGPVDVTEGRVTLSSVVDVARGHRCPGGTK